MISSETPAAEKSNAGSAKPGTDWLGESRVGLLFAGLGSRATSRVTFRDGEGTQKASSSSPRVGGGYDGTSTAALPQSQRQSFELKKKEDINPFKFSADVDFCALSQLDKREKTQVSPTVGLSSPFARVVRNVNGCNT